MTRLKILICGGGCAGPALAFWLARYGHEVVVVERFAAVRATGAQVDLRGQGIEAVRRMGLIDVVRSKLVDELGVAFVDSHGNIRATLLANTSGKGAQSLTSEYEIMRGDLVRILYEATQKEVEYRFGKAVERFEQDEECVVAHFSDGSSDRFDVLVGADGQGSRIRKAIVPSGTKDPYLRMGIHMAHWSVPRTASDRNIRDSYMASGGRLIMRRSHGAAESQAYFTLREQSEEASAIHDAPSEQQKQFWTERFRNAGWQTDRFLEAMKTTESFYSQEVVQVRTNTWFKGRVVLIGDAAYCSSPFSGMGVSGSLVGAYVLAGEISRNASDLSKAFAGYDRTLRPFVDDIQKISPLPIRLSMPKTQWGVRAFRLLAQMACFLRLPDIIAKASNRDRDGSWKLPAYQELESGRRSNPILAALLASSQ